MSELETKDEINSKEVEESTRDEVLERDNRQCVICGRPSGEVHHMDPKGMGGTSNSEIEGIWNKCTICREHHSMDHSGEISMEFISVDDEYVLKVEGHEGRVWFNEKPEKKAEEASYIHNKLMQSFYTVQEHFWEIGGFLSIIKDKNLFEGLDYETFKQYLDSPEIPLSYKSGQKLVRVRRTLEREIRNGNVEIEHVVEMGIEKASRICQFSGRDDFDEWAHKAITLPQDELKAEIRDSKNGEHKSLEESFEESPERPTSESEGDFDRPDRENSEPSGKPDSYKLPEEVEKLKFLVEQLCDEPADKEAAEKLWKASRAYYVHNFTTPD